MDGQGDHRSDLPEGSRRAGAPRCSPLCPGRHRWRNGHLVRRRAVAQRHRSNAAERCFNDWLRERGGPQQKEDTDAIEFLAEGHLFFGYRNTQRADHLPKAGSGPIAEIPH